MLYTPFSYLWDSHIPQIRWDKSRNRVIITEAPDEIPLTRRWLFWRRKTVRGLRVGDSEARFLDLYGSPDARDETMVDLLRVTIENGIVTEISWDVMSKQKDFVKTKSFWYGWLFDDLIHALDGHNGLLCGVAVGWQNRLFSLPCMMPVWRMA